VKCACEVGARAQKDTYSVPPLVMAHAKDAANRVGQVAFQGLVRRQTSAYLSKLVATLSPFTSFRRTSESRFCKDFWTPVFTGVTT
jgi:hypothetical protein